MIRSVGERTEELCRFLILEQGVPPENVVIVRERPFSKTLRVGSEVGIDSKKPWTLFVDADLLLRKGSILRMLEIARKQPAQVCQIQGYCLDKFFGGARIGGVHLYRSNLLSEFARSIPPDGIDIRPESHALNSMEKKGFPWLIVPELVGLHGFEQSYEDIFRTTMVHAHKHDYLSTLFVPFWRSRAASDADYKVALAGFAAGIERIGSVRIDKDAPYFKEAMERTVLAEKGDLCKLGWNLERVEEIVRSWEAPHEYKEVFPDGMTSSQYSTIHRAAIMWRSLVGIFGFSGGTLAAMGRALLYLSRKYSRSESV